jgi:hypothetical protein
VVQKAARLAFGPLTATSQIILPEQRSRIRHSFAFSASWIVLGCPDGDLARHQGVKLAKGVIGFLDLIDNKYTAGGSSGGRKGKTAAHGAAHPASHAAAHTLTHHEEHEDHHGVTLSPPRERNRYERPTEET